MTAGTSQQSESLGHGPASQPAAPNSDTVGTKRWRPRASEGWVYALAAPCPLLGAAAIARMYTLGHPLDIETIAATAAGVAALVLAMLLVALGCGYLSLRYHLGATDLTISWLWVRETIPLTHIDEVFGGVGHGTLAKVKGISLPGYHVGVANLETLGRVSFYGTTNDLSEVIVIVAGGRSYGITPSNARAFASILIERLKAIPDDEVHLGPGPHTTTPRLPALVPQDLGSACKWAAIVALATSLCALLQLSVPVPDTHSPSGAAAYSEINDWTSVGHTFRTDRDGLRRIEVPLTTLKATEVADVQFYVREEPRGANLRTVKKRLTELSEGKILDYYGTRWQDLPWVVFEFEPLYGYAGKELYFNIEGKDIPKANTVQTLFAYPNGYRRGEAYQAESPAGAGMVFRTYATGSISDALSMSFPLLASGRQGFLASESVYQAIAVAATTLLVALAVMTARLAVQEDQK